MLSSKRTAREVLASTGLAVLLAGASPSAADVEAWSEGNGSWPLERVLGFIDHEYCLPLRVEFYGQNGRPRKLLRADPAQVTRGAGSWVPRRIVIEDLVERSQSIFRVDSIEVDIPIAPGLLTVKALPGARR